jgi:probable rRNA maturation factor
MQRFDVEMMDSKSAPLEMETAPEDPDPMGFTLIHGKGLKVDVVVQSGEWHDVFTAELKEKCTALLGDVAAHEGYNAITIAALLADDDVVAGLNKTHRDEEAPTDILSFPADDGDFLGDIVLAYGVVAKQADEMGIPIGDHVLHLLVHGVLHLCGHDHVDPEEAEVMERIEIDILAKHGLTNPYQPPGGRVS